MTNPAAGTAATKLAFNLRGHFAALTSFEAELSKPL